MQFYLAPAQLEEWKKATEGKKEDKKEDKKEGKKEDKKEGKKDCKAPTCNGAVNGVVLHCIRREIFLQCPAEKKATTASCQALFTFAGSCKAYPWYNPGKGGKGKSGEKGGKGKGGKEGGKGKGGKSGEN